MSTQRPDAPPPRPDSAGIVTGLSAVFDGVAFVVRTPRAWPFALVPAVILVLLIAASGWTAWHYIAPWVSESLPASSTWSRFGVQILAFVAAALALVLGAVIALALTPPLSGPALEKLVSLREAALALPPRPGVGFLAEMVCGLRAQGAALMVGLPVLAALWLVTLLLPPLGVVTVPLKYTTVAFMAAWNLLDYPLTLRAQTVRHRWHLIRRDWRPALGFGVGFAVLFAVPCFGVLMLPAAVAGATELAAKLGWLADAAPAPQPSTAMPS